MTWQCYVDAEWGSAWAWLEQIQLDGPVDGGPAIIDVEFTVDALGMGADCTQSNHEFLGDLWSRKLGFEQAQHFQFTLAKWLNEILDFGFWIWICSIDNGSLPKAANILSV